MKHYTLQNNTITRYTSRFAVDANGTRHPLKILTQSEKAAMGVYEAERVNINAPSQWHFEAKLEKHIDGDVVKETPVFELNPPNIIKDKIRRSVEDHIEETAHERNYSSAVSLASYTSSTKSDWAAEAQAFVKWRDDVWEYVFTRLAAVESGEEEPPESAEEFIQDLPVMVWPE